MAISKKSLQAIAALTKTDIAAIEKAINGDGEIDIPIPEGVSSFTPDELTTRDTNVQSTAKKDGERIGEEKGKDLAVKLFKSKLGITDASKDPETVAGLIQSQIKGDGALQEQVKLLQADVATKDKTINELNGQLGAVKTDTELIGLLPTKRSKALETSEHLMLIKNNLEFTEEGVKHKGELMRHEQTKAPLSRKEAIEKFYTDRAGLLEADGAAGGGGGRGGGNSNGGAGGSKTMKDVRLTWQAANPGKPWGNAESQEYMKAALKENPDLVMEDDSQP